MNRAPICEHCGGNHQPEYSCGMKVTTRENDLERIFFQAVYAADERLREANYPGGDTTNLHDEAMKWAGERFMAMQADYDRIELKALLAKTERLEHIVYGLREEITANGHTANQLTADRDALLKRTEIAEGRCTEADKEISQLEGRLCRGIHFARRIIPWSGTADAALTELLRSSPCPHAARIKELEETIDSMKMDVSCRFDLQPCRHATDLAAIRERAGDIEGMALSVQQGSGKLLLTIDTARRIARAVSVYLLEGKK